MLLILNKIHKTVTQNSVKVVHSLKGLCLQIELHFGKVRLSDLRTLLTHLNGLDIVVLRIALLLHQAYQGRHHHSHLHSLLTDPTPLELRISGHKMVVRFVHSALR